MTGCPGISKAASLAMPPLPESSLPAAPMLESITLPLSESRPEVSSSRPKASVTVLNGLCKGCELCVYACPSGNLTMSPGLNSKGYHPAVFSYDGKRGPCSACGLCYWVCPDMAISEIRRLSH